MYPHSSAGCSSVSTEPVFKAIPCAFPLWNACNTHLCTPWLCRRHTDVSVKATRHADFPCFKLADVNRSKPFATFWSTESFWNSILYNIQSVQKKASWAYLRERLLYSFSPPWLATFWPTSMRVRPYIEKDLGMCDALAHLKFILSLERLFIWV